MTSTMIKVKPRGSRRKQPDEMDFFDVPSGFEFSSNKPPAAASRPQILAGTSLRQPTANEAALSAKNYRLAKELSDLRVRHREECKKTSRLTMENMSLASRCREAISHVAMLQRELEIYQQKDAEAIALQRQQTQRFANSLSERQLATKEIARDALPVPPKKALSPMPTPLVQKQGTEKTVTECTPPETRRSSSTGSSPTEMASDDNEKSRDESFQSSYVSPASSADSSNDNDDSSYAFTPSPNSQYSTPNNKDTPIQTSPSRDDLNSPTAMQHRRTQSSTSPMRIPVSPSREHRRATSLDFFEATFSANFPRNFHNNSPQDEGEEEVSQCSTKADVYDPFSSYDSPMSAVVRHSPVDSMSDLVGQSQSPKPSNLDNIIAPMVSWDEEDIPSPPSSPYSSPPRRRPIESSNENQPPKTPAKTPSAEARAKYENAMAPAIQSTPPRHESMEHEPPKPPAKTPSSEVRSMYDFAMRPRENAMATSSSDVHRPSPLLQRIQQKRKQKNKKQLNRQQSEPSSTVPKPDFRRYSSAPESRTVVEATSSPALIAENREANIEEQVVVASQRSGSNRRRSVKQPLSYAEPALNTKVRRGHVFFQKVVVAQDEKDRDVQEQ